MVLAAVIICWGKRSFLHNPVTVINSSNEAFVCVFQCYLSAFTSGPWDTPVRQLLLLPLEKKNYLFGCVGSQLWHVGSFILHVGRLLQLQLTGLHGLSICGAWAYLPHGIWILSSPTRDQTQVPCIARQIFNYWTTREVPIFTFTQGKRRSRVLSNRFMVTQLFNGRLAIQTPQFQLRIWTNNYCYRIREGKDRADCSFLLISSSIGMRPNGIKYQRKFC